MQVSPLKNLKKKDDDDDDEDDDDDDKKKYRNEDYFLKQKDRTDLDFQYTTDFLIGSNKQKMTLLVDTQSWIPTIDCNEKTCPKYSHWFNYSQSSSYSQRKITQKIEYLSGDIQGYEGKDLILFKDSQQGQILVPLLFAYKVDSFIFTNFDGVLGLPNKIKSDSLIDILYDQNLIDNPRFSIQIARFPEPSSDKTRVLDNKDYKNIIQKGDDDDDDDEDDNDNNKQEDNYLNDQYLNDKNSYLYIGQGIPKQILNKTNWVETTSSIQWKTILIGLYHNDNDLIDQLDSHNYDVYFESGTSLSLFPEEIKEYLEELLIKKGCDKKNNQVYCDCNSDNYPKLQFYLRGVKLIFDSNIYFNKTKLSQKKQCLFNVLTSPEDHNFIVFGNSLIRKYLLTFDKKEQKVGFYNSQLVKNESTGIILIFLVNIIILGGLLYVIYETVRQEKTIKGEEDEDQEVFFQELEIYSNRSSFNSTYSRMFNPTLLDEQSFNEGHRYCDMIKI